MARRALLPLLGSALAITGVVVGCGADSAQVDPPDEAADAAAPDGTPPEEGAAPGDAARAPARDAGDERGAGDGGDASDADAGAAPDGGDAGPDGGPIDAGVDAGDAGSVLAFQRAAVGAGLGKADLASGNFAAMPLLSQTGIFTDLAALTPHPSLVPFAPNAQLWSDAAVKHRWVSVPNDGAPYAGSERVTFSATGLWTFPVGTVTVKHFELVVNEVTGARKRLETRIGVLQPNGTFKGASYRWRAEGGEADLVTATVDEVNVITTPGGNRSQTHTYPGPSACTSCHLSTSGFALGLRTAQLNGDLAYPGGVTQNQLRAWGRAEMFDAAFDEASVATYLKTVAITDVAASLETRSRSYFEANCSSCHHPGGPNQAWDARFSTPLAQQGLESEVKAGDPGGSKLYQRMSWAAVDTPNKVNQMMPPIAKNHVDTYALGVVEQWILGL